MISPTDEGTHAELISLSTAQMKDVLEVSKLLAVTPDLDSLLKWVAGQTCSLLGCEGSSIWLYDPAAAELYTKVVVGTGLIRVPVSSGIVGAAFRTNTIVAAPEAYKDNRFNPSNDLATGYVTRSLMACPLPDIDGTPIGVIEVVNKTGDAFTPLDKQLVELYAGQVGVAIQRHRLQQEAYKAACKAAELEHEISLARAVQDKLLPESLPVREGFDLFAWAQSACTTGGDCYDLWNLPDGRLGLFLADASGHGLGPSLVVSQVRTLVRTLCDGSTPLPAPHAVLSRVNQRLAEDLSPLQFVTVFLGFLDSDGFIEWQSAGHGPILIQETAQSPMQELSAPTNWLNLITPLPDDRPEPLHLKNGGMLAVLSDGIFDARSPDGLLFSIAQVIESLNTTRDQPADVAVKHLLATVIDWQQMEQPRDDQTIILLKRKS